MRWLGSLLCMFMLSGCTTTNLAVSFFRSTNDFQLLSKDARIRYESGAEKLAAQVQPYLNEAISTVEVAHYHKFPEPVRVHIPASAQRFSAMAGTGMQPKGAVHPKNGLFLNPDLFDSPERIPRILTHELSHLLMRQLNGFRYLGGAPPWFNEGFAAYISSGGGAEKVSEKEASQFMLAG